MTTCPHCDSKVPFADCRRVDGEQAGWSVRTVSKMQSTFSAQALAHVINPEVPKLISHTFGDAHKIVDKEFSLVVAGYRPSTGPPGIVLSQVPEGRHA